MRAYFSHSFKAPGFLKFHGFSTENARNWCHRSTFDVQELVFCLAQIELWSKNRPNRGLACRHAFRQSRFKMRIQHQRHDFVEYAVMFAIVVMVVVATIRLLAS